MSNNFFASILDSLQSSTDTKIDESTVIVVDNDNKDKEESENNAGGVLILDSDIIYFKSDNPSLEHPFFALTSKVTEPIKYYVHNDIEIRLTGSTAYGFATINDKDVWIYCMSKILQGVKDDIYCQTVKFTVYDFLKQTDRAIGGRGYELFLMALRRLKGTSIETNIETNGKREREAFSLISDFNIIEESDQRMSAVTVTLPKWLIRALVTKKEILTISRDYFSLAPFERRLYEIARKHCGKKQEFKINLDLLKKKIGSLMSNSNFKRRLKRVIEEQNLPDYNIAFCEMETHIIYTKK